MGLRCQITYRKGKANVVNENGTPSVLYRDALELTENQGKALDIWATASLDEFENLTGKKNINDEVKLNEVLQFYNVLKTQETELSAAEFFETKEFMKNNGFTRLSELRSVLNNIFRKDSKTAFPKESIVANRLYSAEEIKTLDLKKINSLINKIDNRLLTEDVVVEPDKNTEKFKNTEVKTLFGTYEIVSQKALDKAIEETLVDFTEEAFYDKIQELAFPDFVEKFYSNRPFANSVMARFKGIRKLPILTIQNDNLVNSKTNTYSTVKNTLRSDINKNLVLAELDYLNSIDLETWNENSVEIQGILGEVEESMVELNIDVIGIKALYKSREDVIALLSNLNNLLNSPTEQNIIDFAQAHDQLIPKKENYSVEKLPAVYDGLTVVKLYTEKTDNELFERFGLIRIAPNTYHKINRSSTTTDLYEYLYNEVREDRLKIPSEILLEPDYKDILNKVRVLEGISRFANLRDSRIISQFQEEISLYQLVFNHQSLDKLDVKTDMSLLTNIETDENYLKEGFVSDFYNYILREKLKNSITYKNALVSFEVNDRDIVLREPIESIENLEYSQELSDYIKLKKDVDMKYLVETQDVNVLDDLLYVNKPELAPEATGVFSIDKEYLITGSNQLSFLRARGKLYRKAIANPNVSLYIEVKTQQDPIYYTNNDNFSFETEPARKILELYDALETKVDTPAPVTDSFIEKLRGSNLTFTKDISERLKGAEQQAKDRKWPNLIQFSSEVLPKEIQEKYKNLYELSARVGIKVNIERGSVPGGFSATWGQGMINIDPDQAPYLFKNWSEFTEVLNHEIIHGLLDRGVNGSKLYEFHKSLKPIVERIQENFDKTSPEIQGIINYIMDSSKEHMIEDFSEENGAKTPEFEELITFAFTNRKFAAFLESIPATTSETEDKKSIFQELKDIIRSFIKNLVSGKTALDEVNEVLDKFFDTGWQEESYQERNKNFNWGEIMSFKEKQAIEDASIISDSNINIISLYSEKEEENVLNKINSCE